MKSEVIATWSGGKDSCFAAYKAVQGGHSLASLVNTISDDYKRVRFHGLEAKVIQLQADALGIPLLQAATTPHNYRQEFITSVKCVMTKRTKGLVFGDIHLSECYIWAEGICREVGVELLEPHFGKPVKELFKDYLQSGFHAIVVSTQASILGKEWIGRVLDASFLQDIAQQEHVDVCGENGEYHTLVLDGPMFQKRLEIKKSQKVFRSGYWFLDIQDVRLVDKEVSSS